MASRIDQDVAQLAERKISSLLQSEISHIIRSNIDDEQVDIAEEVYEYVAMNLLLGDEKHINAFGLLYRVRNRSASHKEKRIMAKDLITWLDSVQMKQYIAKKTYENYELITKGKFRANRNAEKVKLQQSPYLRTDKKSKPSRQPQTARTNKVNSSPSTTESRVHPDKKTDVQIDKSQDVLDYGLESDLFDFFNNQCCTPSNHQAKQEIHQGNSAAQGESNREIAGNENSLKRRHCSYDMDEVKMQNYENSRSPPSRDQSRKVSTDSLNEVQSSEIHPFTVLKLAEGPNDQVQDHLMSQVSSFAHESDFVNCNVYDLQDTSRYGHFLYGDKVDKILRTFTSREQNYILIKWLPRKNGFIPLESVVQSSTMVEHRPIQLARFYIEKETN